MIYTTEIRIWRLGLGAAIVGIADDNPALGLRYISAADHNVSERIYLCCHCSFEQFWLCTMPSVLVVHNAVFLLQYQFTCCSINSPTLSYCDDFAASFQFSHNHQKIIINT